jgi:hypothetical protein
MSRSIQLWFLAGVMTVADLAGFIHCVPIICQAWGSNSWYMSSLFVGMFVWAVSLANLWRAGLRDIQYARIGRPASVSFLPLPMNDEGSNPNV